MKNILNENFITDEQLLIFLDYKEAGKSFPDALGQISTKTPLTQEETDALRSLWVMHAELLREAHNISPNRNLLSQIIEQQQIIESQDPIVTKQSIVGYNVRRVESQFIHGNYNIHRFMQINWKIVAPIIVLVIVVAAAMSMGSKKPASLAVNNQPSSTTVAPEDAMMAMKTAPVKPVSGNVDDLVASLTLEANGDKTLLSDSSTDIALVTADSQSINDFNTTYNETTF